MSELFLTELLSWFDWCTVDKKGRRLSQIELMKMNLKKVEKTEGSDSEEEKVLMLPAYVFLFIFFFSVFPLLLNRKLTNAWSLKSS